MTHTPDWQSARTAMLLDPTVANLNTGSFGPLPRRVFDDVTQLRLRLAEEPMAYLLREAPPQLWAAREELARFLHADVRRLAFMANVTAAINTVAAGLRIAAPGEILLSDHEYGAMHWCWERAAQRQGLTLRTFPLPILAREPDEVVAAFRAALTPRTRLFFFSHVLSPTGMVLPAAALCAAARQHGVLTVVDGAHAPALVPLDLERINADFYGGNCHKWLLAPTGSGFLYLGKGNEDRLQPLQVSWGYRHERGKADERDEHGSTGRLRQFEFEGIRDPSAWIAVRTALAVHHELGGQAIRERNAGLVRCVRERIGALGLPLATPTHPELHGFMTAFRLPPHIQAPTLRTRLWQERIELPVVERPEGLLLRVSTHYYNTETEIERLARVLPELLK